MRFQHLRERHFYRSSHNMISTRKFHRFWEVKVTHLNSKICFSLRISITEISSDFEFHTALPKYVLSILCHRQPGKGPSHFGDDSYTVRICSIQYTKTKYQANFINFSIAKSGKLCSLCFSVGVFLVTCPNFVF